jgi:hypothetical protein
MTKDEILKFILEKPKRLSPEHNCNLSACQKYVSLKYYDEGSKKVKCKCDAKAYSWKK